MMEGFFLALVCRWKCDGLTGCIRMNEFLHTHVQLYNNHTTDA